MSSLRGDHSSTCLLELTCNDDDDDLPPPQEEELKLVYNDANDVSPKEDTQILLSQTILTTWTPETPKSTATDCAAQTDDNVYTKTSGELMKTCLYLLDVSC